MLLSVVSVLVVAQSSSEVPEGLMNNPVLKGEKDTRADIRPSKFIKNTGKQKKKSLESLR